MKLTPAYQVEQEAKKVFEQQCRNLYFYRLDTIGKDIEYWKSKGYFSFAKRFLREGDDAVNYKVEKMIKRLLVGYGYKVGLTYDTPHIVLIEISWRESYLTSLYKYFKRFLFKKKNNE